MKPLKLRTKLALFYAAVFTFLLTLVSVLFYNLLAYELDRALHDELAERGAALRGYLDFKDGKAKLVYNASDPEEAFFIQSATRYYQIYDATNGALIVRSPAMAALGFQYTPEEVKERIHGPNFSGIVTDQIELLFHNDVLKTPGGHVYLLQVGSATTFRNTALRELLKIISWLLPSGVIFALLSGWWMARSVLRPLESLSAAAGEISISQLHRRLPLTGAGDELDRLAGTFNKMFDRLEKAVTQMKDFTAAISHELRTPLTVLRGEAEVTLAKASSANDYRRTLESQLEEYAKLARMIDQMLTLARAEAGQIVLARENVDLSRLVNELVEQMEAVAESKSIILTAEPAESVAVIGDAGWLERVILNLLDNAIKFTHEGGRVRVRVLREADQAVLEVQDNGMGITSQALPHIFEWFYRGDPSRSKELDGAGLGLSLAEWIVKEHHGRISVASQQDQGTLIRVFLPSAASAPQPH
jgi:heavy metal sensor kinase